MPSQEPIVRRCFHTGRWKPLHIMRPGSYPPKWFFFFWVKSFYWPRGSNFSSRFQWCLGGPWVHTAAPTRTCMLGIGDR
jgi:hypothetical protein